MINSVNFGSTGKIMLAIADIMRKKGHTVCTCCPDSLSARSHRSGCDEYIGTRFERNLHIKLGEISGFHGCFSMFSTWRFLSKVKRFKPDAIHLHNLHHAYINLGMLFNYIKKNNIPVIWTLHDCWAFTGQCPYFTIANCEKWKTGCGDCTQHKRYPSTSCDRTQTMWKLKKKWFTSINNMTVVTPSSWLGELVKQSYLKDYNVQVINNGINLDIFKPTESNFRSRYHCEDKFILLGVAFDWGYRKGLDVFVEISKRLDSRYQIVLVGTNSSIDKNLPENIISIHRTADQAELAEIYSAADLFVNPTREENYPTVNMESIACGTPVLSFHTGGSAEIFDASCGCSVPSNDIDALLIKIAEISENRPYSTEACLRRAAQFDQAISFEKYCELYRHETR